MVNTRSTSASCLSPHRPRNSSTALAPRKHKKKRRALAMVGKKAKLRRQKALQKRINVPPALTNERGNRSSASNPKTDPQKPIPHQILNTRLSTATATKTSSKQAFQGRKTSSKQAVGPIEENLCERNCNSSKRNRKSSSPRQTINTRLRILESAEACTKEINCDQLKEGNYDCGWTLEQDKTLQTAYFQIRPSANFWFEVSKKVPGKTAKDCFDRFYSAHPTPPTTQLRSKKILTESPVRTISFVSPMHSVNCKGRFGRGKQGLLKAHQTVRHILRHQKVADELYEADVFSAVERLNPSDSLLKNCIISTTPAPVLKRNNSKILITTPATCSGYAKSGDEVWWSASSKPRTQPDHAQIQQGSKLARRTPLLSPEVLKAEGNPSRLDRFLDILHMRRVPKKKASSLKGMMGQSHECLKSESRSTQCVAAAREAILMDAREVLKTSLQRKSIVKDEASLSSDQTDDESSQLSE